jgi:hypothetical protein
MAWDSLNNGEWTQFLWKMDERFQEPFSDALRLLRDIPPALSTREPKSVRDARRAARDSIATKLLKWYPWMTPVSAETVLKRAWIVHDEEVDALAEEGL